jgi:trehalose 6-phosphate phosphatase
VSKDILGPANRHVLAKFASSNVLLAFDFDGTLAPIVAAPERARMRTTTARLMSELSNLYPCVVISGRARADVLERLGGVPVLGVIGNHGIEPGESSKPLRDEVHRWYPLLQERLSRLAGVKIENKDFSVSIHYRQSRDKKSARAAIMDAVAALGDVRVIGGAQVVNILPAQAPHKGIALMSELERLGCETAIYVGDDDTDEDVFALDQPARLLTIRVGPKPTSAASYAIGSQSDVDELLRVLVSLRERSQTARELSSVR